MDHNRQDLLNISFSEAFFEDEVKEGFFVTTMMKRYWAVQLKVLSVIAGICDRHGLNWFADYGTLMGAVRHEGYIPWDDDLDICMLRSDWLKFFEYAKTELPEGFVIMTLKEQPEYRELIGRVVNSHAINYSPEFMKEFYGCPYTVGVDIFPVDGVYDDAQKEEDRNKRARQVLEAYNIVVAEGAGSPRLRALLPEIERRNRVHLKGGRNLEGEIIRLIDRIYSECSDVGVQKVALMRFFIEHGHHIYDRKMFEAFVELPFENTYIRVPVRYDEKLRMDYGNYMNVAKAGGIHDYPVFSEQEDMLREHIGRNPYRYTMDNQELLRSISRYIMKATAPKAEKEIRKVLFLPCRAEWWNTMEGLWKRAVDNPSLTVQVVALPYYDRNYDGDYLDEHYEKELFPDYVNALDYRSFDLEQERPDIIVMQVPYDGWNTAMAVDDVFFSDNLVKYTDQLVYVPCFDPEDSEMDGDKAEVAIRILAEQPAVVNADKVVLESERMKQVYLRKLVELTGEPTRDYWNQKLVMVDELDWIDAGNETGRTFEECVGKSITDNVLRDDEWKALVGDVAGKKVVVYYVTISFLMEYGSQAIDKMRRSLTVFAENSERITVVLLPQEAVLKDLARLDDALWNQYMELVSEIGDRWKNCIYDSDGVTYRHIDLCDAFYGDPGMLPRQCVLKNKPVMLQNPDV